jgi:SAM-dependent methyltransferase
MKPLSRDYRDSVFKDGKFIGRFDEMYRYSKDIPWHQDKLAYEIFSEIDIAILKQYKYKSVCEIGCGLGFFSKRLCDELGSDKKKPEITGIDISPNAIQKAAKRFPQIRFITADLLKENPLPKEKFDLVIIKEVLWYVCHDLNTFFKHVVQLVKNRGFLYVSLAFPESKVWVGKEIIDCPETLKKILCRYSQPVHYCVEYDWKYHARPLVHYLGRVSTHEDK